jgi:predicted RNA-binding protein with TRAM domain
VSDVVHLTSNDPLATIGPDVAMVNGQASIDVKLATGGYQQITVSDVSNGSKPGSTTQVRAISSGLHLEASVTPTTARAGEPFTLTVKAVNDAGSVIREVNSWVTVTTRHASTGQPGRGTLITTQFQLLQGQRAITENYTFVEPIVIVAHDDAGNAPAVANAIDITPGPAATLRLTSNPTWLGGNQSATLTALLTDEFNNGIPDQAMSFAMVSGTGTLTPIDATTGADGSARAGLTAPRQPESEVVRASSGGLSTDLTVEVSLVDPNAPGGSVTNFPNPCHPPEQGTTLAYKLDDMASVKIRIFSQTGQLVKEVNFARGATGGAAGLNAWQWDGRNGSGDVVASGGYIVLIEAQGTGSTVNVMRRKIAVVR